MAFSNLHLYLLFINKFILLLVSAKNETNTSLYTKNRTVVHVGVILDFHSSTGFVANSCISTAISDFYTKSPHYSTRLVLHPKNSNNLLTAASAVLELVNEDQVDAIIGPQYPNETRFVAEIGRISQVPIISFSMTGSSLRPTQTPYFIQTKPPESSQLKGITSLIKQLGWHATVVLYQDDTDDESGYGFISSLTDTFQKASIQLSYVIAISSSVNVSHIRQELSHLKTKQTRVFLVHVTSPTLASRLFYLANVGIMSNQTAWIITDALSKTLSSLDAKTIESMEGVLGIRHYIPSSEKMENLKNRWNKNELDICLRAYDTVWALATAVEKIQFPEVKRSHKKLNASSPAIPSLGISEVGPRLVKEILETRFLGASGEFNSKHGQLVSAVFEIINVVGNGGRTVGYWTSQRGFSRKIVGAYEKDHGAVYSERLDRVLKPIIWPGDSTTKPKGWDVPGMGQKLKVGVPRRTGFTEFVNVQEIGDTKKYNVTGFCIDVFQAALDSLSFKLEPEYFPILVVDNGRTFGTNDDPSGTKTPDYDDVTIRADREEKVDFSLPYLESGVVMVVRAEPDRLKNMWIFLKPLSWDLWLMIVLAAIFIGLVLQMLERRVNPQRQLRLLFLFPLAALAFPEKNMVQNNWARFVLVVWLFMAYILMQSYTANLSSILTVAQLRTSADIPACAGYQEGSFVKDLLIKLNIKCLSYKSIEAYNEALSLGCKKGGVDAIFDEIPYIKLFIHKYGSRYKIVGPTYRTGGFGFAFPAGSPLSKPVSKAILDVMEKGTIQDIEKRYFGVGYTSQYHDNDISRDGPSLTSYSFAGLFTSTAFLTLLALGCSECSFAISRWHNQRVTNVSGVPFVEMDHDIPPEIDQKGSEAVIITGQEGDQQVLPEPKNIDNHHRDG